MRITPIDILNRKFPRKMRGYSMSAVDDFLRELADDYQSALEENASLKDQIALMQKELKGYRDVDNAMKEALVLAQQSAEDVRNAARREGELIVREAQTQATHIMEEIQDRVAEYERQLDQLKEQRKRFGWEFRALLQAHLDSITSGLSDSAITTSKELPADMVAPSGEHAIA